MPLVRYETGDLVRRDHTLPDEPIMRIAGREIAEPGADRMMIFQEFDQLLPWKTVLENVMFPLLMTRKLSRKDAEARARAYIELREPPQ